MHRFEAFSRHINRFVGHAAMHIYLIVALLSVYEVILRYAFNAPTTWSYEIILSLCAAAWALSGGYVALKGRHIAITIFYEMAPHRVRRIMDIVSGIVSIFALSFLVFLSYELAVKALRWIDKSGSAFNSPLPTLVTCVLVAGAALFLLQVVAELVRILRDPEAERR